MFTDNFAVAGKVTGSVLAQGGVRATLLPTPTGLAGAVGNGSGSIPQGTYFYRVSAFNDLGETLASTEISYFAPDPVASNVIRLTWTPVVGATGYKLYGRASGAELLLATIAGGINATYLDSSLTPVSGPLPTANTTGKGEFLAGFTNPFGFAKVFTVLTPAAASVVSVHAAHSASGANTFPGPITNPDRPRNAQVAFSAGWDGGDVTVNGTDQFDVAVSEVFLSGPGTTVVGAKVFKTVTSITKTVVGTTGTASVGGGNKLGFAGKLVDTTSAVLFANNVAEGFTLDATNNSFLPTTLPTGAVSYTLIANIKE